MQTRAKVVVCYPTFLLPATFLGETVRTVSRGLLWSVCKVSLMPPGGALEEGWGGVSGLRMARTLCSSRLIITIVYSHILMSPVNSGALLP